MPPAVPRTRAKVVATVSAFLTGGCQGVWPQRLVPTPTYYLFVFPTVS
jgi:hypothetical protein